MDEFLYDAQQGWTELVNSIGIGEIIYTRLEDAVAEHHLKDIPYTNWLYVGALVQENK